MLVMFVVALISQLRKSQSLFSLDNLTSESALLQFEFDIAFFVAAHYSYVAFLLAHYLVPSIA